jgi:glutathione S-transferase
MLLRAGRPNRGEQVRLLLALAGTEFEDHRMKFPDGKTPLTSLGAGDAAPLAFDLCPIVQHNDPEHGELSIGIVPGSMMYIAEKHGLIPADLLSRTLAVSLVDASEMMRDDIFYGSYGQLGKESSFFNRAKARQDIEGLDTEPYYKWLSHFERYLRRKKAGAEPLTAGNPTGPFVLGATICYADVAIYDCVMGIWAMDLFDEQKGRERSPLLCQLVQAVANTPGIKEYEAARGGRREYYAEQEEEGNRRFAERQAAKQAKL